MAKAIEFYESARYISGANLQDNILFGKVAHGEAEASALVGRLLAEVIEETGLRESVVSVGLGFNVGIAGSRLTLAQRQKLILARSVIKRPDVLIVADGLAALDASVIEPIMKRLVQEMEGRCLIWIISALPQASNFDRIVVMRRGKVVKTGSYAELNGDGDGLAQLIEDKA